MTRRTAIALDIDGCLLGDGYLERLLNIADLNKKLSDAEIINCNLSLIDHLLKVSKKIMSQ